MEECLSDRLWTTCSILGAFLNCNCFSLHHYLHFDVRRSHNNNYHNDIYFLLATKLLASYSILYCVSTIKDNNVHPVLGVRSSRS